MAVVVRFVLLLIVGDCVLFVVVLFVLFVFDARCSLFVASWYVVVFFLVACLCVLLFVCLPPFFFFYKLFLVGVCCRLPIVVCLCVSFLYVEWGLRLRVVCCM